MELIDFIKAWHLSISASPVALDTNVFIYFYENNEKYVPVIRPIFKELTLGSLHAVTSIISLIELVTLPIKEQNLELVQSYSDALLKSQNLTTLDVNPAIALKAAELRATYKLRTPDAIQIATGIVAGAEIFITNDARLKQVNEISVQVIEDFVIPTSKPITF